MNGTRHYDFPIFCGGMGAPTYGCNSGLPCGFKRDADVAARAQTTGAKSRGPQKLKLTWRVLGEGPAARSHKVEDR